VATHCVGKIKGWPLQAIVVVVLNADGTIL